VIVEYGRSAESLAKVLSGNLQSWERARPRSSSDRLKPVCDFVILSRQAGSGGSRIANRLGEQIGWPVFDREILHAMSADDQVRERLYAWMDERDAGWLEQVLEYFVAGRFPPHDYLPKLGKAIFALARGAPGIFVGRAADLILPQDQGLRIRIVAPREDRMRGFGLAHSLEKELAAAEVERLDRARAEFVRSHFQREADDSTRYDLVLNTARVSDADAVELMTVAMRLRGFVK
jgi:cytidylate kinase